MFTGIIEAVGNVRSSKKIDRGMKVEVTCSRNLKLRKGNSLAVDGVCLTCEKVKGRVVEFTLSSETLERTHFGSLTKGRTVNLERPLAASGRLGGHFVQGHVDGTGAVASVDQDSPGWRLALELPLNLLPYCVEKGSIAINGVSLTIAGIRGNRIWIALIPFTWENTALSELGPGDLVNVEVDLLAKYVRNFTATTDASDEQFLWKFVREG
ncbi:MAG TPA: riboflavin synthase [Acidobacteriota bacterium]|jgi:riboflavin synthase